MATPVIVACPAGAWTKVATNVQTGFIHKMKTAPNVYLQTYRDTGDAPPTLRTEGVEAFVDEPTEAISAVAGIDIYLWVDDVAGRVRVDL
jgi:hypothetical protein